MPYEAELQQLAAIEPGPRDVISVYLDLQPQGTSRPGLIYLREALNEMQGAFWPRGAEFESIQDDAARIAQYVEDAFDRSYAGLALFASRARGLWLPIQLQIAPSNAVVLDTTPYIYPLVRLLDQFESYAVVVADERKGSIYHVVLGAGESAGDFSAQGSVRPQHTKGFSEVTRRRRVENRTREFMEQMAAALQRLVAAEGIKHIVLAGDERFAKEFEQELPQQLRERVAGITRLDVRIPEHGAIAATLPVLADQEQRQERALVADLQGAVLSGGLGVAGLQATRRALEEGRVETLVISDNFQSGLVNKDDLITMALQYGGTVETISDDEFLRNMGGIGAFIRYRSS